MASCLKTGLNEAFVIDKEKMQELFELDNRSKEILKPVLSGREVKRYQTPEAEKYLILTTKGIDINSFPAIKTHLLKYKPRLEKRAGIDKWFELQASPGDTYRFEANKIMYPDISKEANFILDKEGQYCINTVYCISNNELSLLGYLNSNLFKYYFSNISNSIRGGYFRFFTEYMLDCPVMENSKELDNLVSQIIAQKKAGSDTQVLEQKVNTLVYKSFQLTEEEIKIIEESVE